MLMCPQAESDVQAERGHLTERCPGGCRHATSWRSSASHARFDEDDVRAIDGHRLVVHSPWHDVQLPGSQGHLVIVQADGQRAAEYEEDPSSVSRCRWRVNSPLVLTTRMS